MSLNKAIILAGGLGTRLNPITKIITKHLLPIYNLPLIYYPILTLLNSNIKKILIISDSKNLFFLKKLLGDGSFFKIKIQYKIQKKPNGISEAFIIGKKFIANDDVVLILGDNVFLGSQIKKKIKIAKKNLKMKLSTIFAIKVKDPERFGVAYLKSGNLVKIVEKPKKPLSNLAIPGIYFFTNDVVRKVKEVIPSKRGELEITSLLNIYKNLGLLKCEVFDKKNFYWKDAGTFESILEASNYIKKNPIK